MTTMHKKLSDLTLTDLLAGACYLGGVVFGILALSEAWFGLWWPQAAQNAALAVLGYAGFYLLCSRRKAGSP